jgi:RNA polymerase sigma factor (sigma-70 family)
MGSDSPHSAGQHLQRLFAEGSLTGLSDGQLLERYLTRHDELAFETLVERHAAMVLTVCRRSLADASNLDDAFQATFLVLARRSRGVRNQKALASWLFGVARRVCLLANRAAVRRRKHERRAAEQRGTQRKCPTEPDENAALVYEEIERLPSAYRLPVVLCLMEGRSRAEAAEALRWTEGMVRGRLARARRLLRSRLIRRGVVPGAAMAVLTREGTAAGTVPRGLIEGAAHAASGRATAHVAALTGRVIKIMLLKKLTLSATALCGALLVTWTAFAVLSAGEEQAAGVAVVQAAPERAAPPGFLPLGDPGKSALHGRVIDPDGNPVPGARVRLNTQGNQVLAETRTDGTGAFHLGPIAPLYRNRFELLVDADHIGRVTLRRDAIKSYPGLDGDVGSIQVDRGRIFTGQVLDADGKPLPGATIEPTVYRHIMGHTVENIGLDATLSTDAEGRFRTPPLPIGQLALAVRAADHQLGHIARPIRPGGEEDLGAVRLEKDVPVTGVVKDEEGGPIDGVRIVAGSGRMATTDAEGKFTVRGLGPNPSFQMNVRKDGYALVIGRVTVTEAGFRYVTFDSANPAAPPKPAPLTRELAVTLKRVGWIEGRAIDADTGEPVRLDNVALREFTRKPGGEVVLRRGVRNEFEQPEPGRFRVPFAAPDEFHLTFSVAGYHDAEAFTPRVTELKTVEGIVARLKRRTEGSAPTLMRPTIAGTVTRDGRPVTSGWVALWRLMRSPNTINAAVKRGRTVVGPPVVNAVPIHDGSYTMDPPFQGEGWYVVAEEPGYPLTQVGPITIAQNEKKTLDIACTEGGRIRGLVKGVPAGWEGNVWVVAFSKTAVREEARVSADGTFALPLLPPGEYGLKAGHDAYEDAEVYPGSSARDHPEAAKEPADPWKRAKVVTVKAGEETAGVEVEFPNP